MENENSLTIARFEMREISVEMPGSAMTMCRRQQRGALESFTYKNRVYWKIPEDSGIFVHGKLALNAGFNIGTNIGVQNIPKKGWRWKLNSSSLHSTREWNMQSEYPGNGRCTHDDAFVSDH